ncbi:hypothetical protein SNOG_12186 [Parastagonospora nodorum SN15]|uniref:Uncharacterized protein n=1 Tax=Phaeosphaeria nodorum (strain SN15 / ATCC MYA-4574 / FGSC 10173) TaxID=321614 RepID=Q0U7S8_PHANO|nr:hypothetical protein SNOG_12186 [Parastagonospora nodorum SN15]EAT80598.1 hypothetical protein SNOG_12186 [Parastagonospora nodorum SN15]
MFARRRKPDESTKCQDDGGQSGELHGRPPPASSSFLHKESLLDLHNTTQPPTVCTKLHIRTHTTPLEAPTVTSPARLPLAPIPNRRPFPRQNATIAHFDSTASASSSHYPLAKPSQTAARE